jgi:hypothetical protein
VPIKPPSLTLQEAGVVPEAAVERPLFADAHSDDERPVVSDPETLSDTELNIYGSKLPND